MPTAYKLCEKSPRTAHEEVSLRHCLLLPLITSLSSIASKFVTPTKRRLIDHMNKENNGQLSSIVVPIRWGGQKIFIYFNHSPVHYDSIQQFVEKAQKNILLFDMAEVNDKSQSTHQSPNIGNSGGHTRLLNNARNIDVGHHHLATTEVRGQHHIFIDLASITNELCFSLIGNLSTSHNCMG